MKITKVDAIQIEDKPDDQPGWRPIVCRVYTDTGLQGRRSPSFPLGYDDFERVNLAVNRLLKKAQDQGLKFRM